MKTAVADMDIVVRSKENTLLYYPGKCVNCDRCIEVCPHVVFERGERVVEIVEHEACMECGACAINCPTEALKVEAGVGCAYALMWQAIKGTKEPSCGCG